MAIEDNLGARSPEEAAAAASFRAPTEPESVPAQPEAESSAEKETPLTAHERWKQRWETRYSKIVPEIAPLAFTVLAMAVPPLEAVYGGAGHNAFDEPIRFWTEEIMIAGPAMVALVTDRLIRKKARITEQEAVEEDNSAARRQFLEEAIKQDRLRLKRYRAERDQVTDEKLEIVYSDHIVEATEDLDHDQHELAQLENKNNDLKEAA